MITAVAQIFSANYKQIVYISLYTTLVITICLLTAVTFAATKNGFVLDDALVPETEILQGGPPRDGIPAIHDPVFLSAEDADYLKDTDRILGLEIEGQSKAYPIRILNWHEVVNDSANEMNFSVTYCPLCGTGVAFKGTNQSSGIQFGVSGLLYNSDVLLYDLSTESLWSQLLGKAVSGERLGEELIKLPLQHTTWKAWLEKHPDSLVLSDETGFSRDYDRDPYDGYTSSPAIFFPLSEKIPSNYHPKEQIIGLQSGDDYIAFPFVELNKQDEAVIRGQLGNLSYKLKWDKTHQSAIVYDNDEKLLPIVQAFWFAWYTFHPQTDVFKASSQ